MHAIVAVPEIDLPSCCMGSSFHLETFVLCMLTIPPQGSVNSVCGALLVLCLTLVFFVCLFPPHTVSRSILIS